MSRNSNGPKVTINQNATIEEALEGIPGHSSYDSSDVSDIDDLSVLTDDDAAKFIKSAIQNPDFEAIKQYCESRYDAEIDEENAKVIHHPYLSSDYSATFDFELPNKDSNKHIKLNIVVYFEDQSVSQTVAFMDLLINDETKEIQVIRHMNGGFTEYIVER